MESARRRSQGRPPKRLSRFQARAQALTVFDGNLGAQQIQLESLILAQNER